MPKSQLTANTPPDNRGGKHGFEKLGQQCSDWISQLLEQDEAEGVGETPIEKLLFSAIRLQSQMGATEYIDLRIVHSENEERQLLSASNTAFSLIIRPQAQLKWKVDFLIHYYDWARKGGPSQWRRIIVECDGHNFHERNKEQAARDRSRDRMAVTELDATILRFTGSEIWRDPWGCAEQIFNTALRGWP